MHDITKYIYTQYRVYYMWYKYKKNNNNNNECVLHSVCVSIPWKYFYCGRSQSYPYHISKATKHNQTWFYNLLSLTHLKKSKTECNRVEKQKSFEKLYKRHFSYEMMPSDIFLLIIFVCAYVIVQHFTIFVLFFSFSSCCLVVVAFKL